jgi:hypothetical protein
MGTPAIPALIVIFGMVVAILIVLKWVPPATSEAKAIKTFFKAELNF